MSRRTICPSPFRYTKIRVPTESHSVRQMGLDPYSLADELSCVRINDESCGCGSLEF